MSECRCLCARHSRVVPIAAQQPPSLLGKSNEALTCHKNNGDTVEGGLNSSCTQSSSDLSCRMTHMPRLNQFCGGRSLRFLGQAIIFPCQDGPRQVDGLDLNNEIIDAFVHRFPAARITVFDMRGARRW